MIPYFLAKKHHHFFQFSHPVNRPTIKFPRIFGSYSGSVGQQVNTRSWPTPRRCRRLTRRPVLDFFSEKNGGISSTSATWWFQIRFFVFKQEFRKIKKYWDDNPIDNPIDKKRILKHEKYFDEWRHEVRDARATKYGWAFERNRFFIHFQLDISFGILVFFAGAASEKKGVPDWLKGISQGKKTSVHLPPWL